MGDEAFESLCFRLIRLEFPDAVKPANTSDGGADAALPTRDGAYSRCWQAKHHPRRIRWAECQKSLRAAIEHWAPQHYTFCFPRELTVREQKTFDQHFRTPDMTVYVDYWNGEELQARLTGSPEGQRVARTFFVDSDDRENTYRAIEAGGRLETPADALDRMANIGSFLASGDAFFSYPAATHEADGPAPEITPGAVMSVRQTDGSTASRVDVVPRDAEAMQHYAPKFTLRATGEEAIRQVQAALDQGAEVEIPEGAEITFTQLPPAMKDMVGERLTGVVKLGPAKRTSAPSPAPWDARIRAETDAGVAHFDVFLRPSAAPEGWRAALSGTRGGLTVTVIGRQKDTGGGEVRWKFHYTRDSSDVAEQISALKLFEALCGAGELTVADRLRSGQRELRAAISGMGVFDDAMQALLRFLEDVHAIENWATVKIPLPDSITPDEARDVYIVAQAIRQRGQDVIWHNSEMVLPEIEATRLRPGAPLRILTPIAAKLLGRTIDLGFSQLEVSDFNVASVTPADGRPDLVRVRIEPPNSAGAPLFQHLVRGREKSRRPPPPPARRGRRPRRSRRRR